jgi:uncharacterized protein YjdB
VATVSYVGYVTAVGLGTARIAVTALGKSAEAEVQVVAIPVAGILLSPSSLVLAPGETLPLTAAAVDAAGRTLSERSLAWLSSDTSVAAVSAAGLLTGVAPGVASVSAVSEGVFASISVRVSGPAGAVARVTVSPGAASTAVGQTLQLGTTLEDAAGNLATNRPVTWTSTAPNVATVTPTGLVRALAPGRAVIEATSEGQRGSAAVVVVDPLDAVTVRISVPALNEVVSDTLRIYASVTARHPIATVHAKAFIRETDLRAVPAGALGKSIAWVGTMDMREVQYGPYEVVVTAIDVNGNEGIATVRFQRGPRDGGGGTGLPPRSK